MVIDDIISSGWTAARAISALRADGQRPAGVLTVFNYEGRLHVGLREEKLPIRSLATVRPRRRDPAEPQIDA
jgi:orotate phosphoribosyltransferase